MGFKGSLFTFGIIGLLYYFEVWSALRLPAPSCKLIGEHFLPRIPAKQKGAFRDQNYLHRATQLYKGIIHGSESVAVGQDGDLYMLDRFATVYRASSDQVLERVGHLGAGRPLGFEVDAAGNLFVCNAATGLQMMEEGSKRVILLSSEAPASFHDGLGTPILYADDLQVSSSGEIYFTDATDIPPSFGKGGYYDTMYSYILAALQGQHSGRLLRYEPKSRQTQLLAGGMCFANGVALSDDESFVLVVDTCMLRVNRLWLKGIKEGHLETFFEFPPGYPDGISRGSNGSFWLALPALGQPLLEFVLHSRLLRWLAPRLPIDFNTPIFKGTAVLQLSSDGKVMRYMADADGSHIQSVSAVTETPDGLFLGNLQGDYISFLSKDDFAPLQHAFS